MQTLNTYDRFIGQRVSVTTTEHVRSTKNFGDVTSIQEDVVPGDPVMEELTKLAEAQGHSVYPDLRGWARTMDVNYNRANVRFERREGGHYISAIVMG